MDYHAMLAAKAPSVNPCGFAATIDDGILFPFQRAIVEWAIGLGRAAIFADTGLGKTGMQLTWAHHVALHTGKPVLLLAPIAVGQQTIGEAIHFGIPDVRQVKDGSQVRPGINVCNYERLHLFDSSVFGGVVLDESSILKNYSGKVKKDLCDRFACVPYRLACTATPAPNDYLELGNHSEFLGIMTSHKMIARWFISDQSEAGSYRLKGHAVGPFWDWVTSWARCIGVPSDMGDYSDEGYVLPELRVHRHTVSVDITNDKDDGTLFRRAEASATMIHKEKRRTVMQRARASAELAMQDSEPCIVWVETNYDADAVLSLIPGAMDLRGSTPDPQKEAILRDFTAKGGVIVTKPGIAGMGLNWQHCARMVFAGLSYSYEGYYQAVRRAYRFGQKRPVDVHIIMAATEAAMWMVIDRKANDHNAMKLEMFAASRRACARIARTDDYNPTHLAPIPSWLRTEIR